MLKAWADRFDVRAVFAGSAAGEVVEVKAFGVVELQGAGECIEHAVGGAAKVAALEPYVVIDADLGEPGDLIATQAGNAPFVAAHGYTGRLWRQSRAARGEELPDLVTAVHAAEHRRTPRPAARKPRTPSRTR